MKNQLSIKFLYWITNIMLGFIAFMILIILALKVSVILNVGFDNSIFTMELPVEVGGDVGLLTYEGTEYNVVLTEAVGKIGIDQAPKSLFIWGLVALLLFLFLALAFTWIFRKFIVNVREGKTFSIQNMNYLKYLSYLIVAFWTIRLLYYKLLYYLLVGNIQFETIKFNNDFDYQFLMLIPALFLGVLSHVFSKGKEMEEELNLTV